MVFIINIMHTVNFKYEYLKGETMVEYYCLNRLDVDCLCLNLSSNINLVIFL